MPVAPCEKDDTTAVLEWTYTDDRMVAYHGAAKGGVGYFLSTLARGPATLPSTSSTRGPRQTRQVYQGCKHPSGFRPTSRPSSARDIKDLGPKWRAISYYETEPRVINDHVQCLQKLETQRVRRLYRTRENARSLRDEQSKAQRELFQGQCYRNEVMHHISGQRMVSPHRTRNRPQSAMASLGQERKVTFQEDENDCESPPPTDRRRPVHSASRNRAARELEQAMNDLDKFDERLEVCLDKHINLYGVLLSSDYLHELVARFFSTHLT